MHFMIIEKHSQSDKIVFSMLHKLVAPVMTHAASMCTMCAASSCFLDSTDALSYTESQYSDSGQTKYMYICSNDLLLSLDFRTRGKLSLDQAFVVIV